MDKKTVGLVGVISVLPLAAAPTADARTLDQVMSPRSYAELLQPIPNAAALLREAEARKATQSEPRIQMAQYYGNPYYDGYTYYPYRRWRHHHHHHHHHHGWGWGGWGYYGPPRYYHHHHHHWNDWRW
jgi:hypothetical protein